MDFRFQVPGFEFENPTLVKKVHHGEDIAAHLGDRNCCLLPDGLDLPDYRLCWQ